MDDFVFGVVGVRRIRGMLHKFLGKNRELG